MSLFQPSDEVLDTAQVCDVLGVTKAQLGRLATAGVLRPTALLTGPKGWRGSALYSRAAVENVQLLYKETSTIVEIAARYGRTVEEVQAMLDRYAALEYFDDPVKRERRYRARGRVWETVCYMNAWGSAQDP